MPILSMFYGIVVSMYWDDHNPPHIHVRYNDSDAIFDLDGVLINGSFPTKQQKYVEAWILIHQDELKANWSLAEKHEQLFKIEPLK